MQGQCGKTEDVIHFMSESVFGMRLSVEYLDYDIFVLDIFRHLLPKRQDTRTVSYSNLSQMAILCNFNLIFVFMSMIGLT